MFMSILDSLKKVLKKFHNMVFYKIFVLFIVAIIIPVLLFGFLSLRHSTEYIMKQVKQSSINSISDKKNIIDQRIQEIDKLFNQILSNTNIKKLQHAVTLTYKEHLIMRDVLTYLSEIKRTNGLVNSIYIYDTKFNYILSGSKYGLHDFEDPEAVELFNFNATRTVHRQYKDKDIVSYIYMPEKLMNFSNMIIMINIDFNNLFNYGPDHPDSSFDTLIFDDSYSQILLDSNQLTSVNSKIMHDILHAEETSGIYSIEGTDYFACKVRSDTVDWNIVYLQPYESLVNEASFLKKLIISSLIMVLLLSFIFAYLFSFNIYKPIGRLAAKVREQIAPGLVKSDNAYKSIDDAIMLLFNKNRELMSKYRTMFPYFKQYSVNDLLSGEIFDIDKFANVLDLLGINFTYSSYVNVVFDFESTLFSGNKRGLLDSALSGFKNKIAYIVFNINAYRASAIINTDMKDNEIYKMMDTVKQYLNSNNTDLTIAIGNLYNDIGNAYSHHRQTLALMDSKFFTGKNRIILPNDKKKVSMKFIYDKKLEEKLISLISDHNGEAAVNTLELIVAKLVNNNSSIEYIRYVYFEVFRNIMDSMDAIGIDFAKTGISISKIFEKTQGADTIADLGNYAESTIFSCVKLVEEYRKMQHQVVVDKAIEFMKTNFYKDITLEQVAKKVFLSPGYFNTIFKTLTGSTIYEYITQLRMEAATRLLSESNHRVKDIAGQIGYNNVQNFLRLFKKRYNMTPVEYRRSL